MPSSTETRFSLATVSVAGSPPYAALVVDERAIALSEVARFAAAEGQALGATDSVLSVLQAWSQNFPVLQRVAGAIAGGRAQALVDSAVPVKQLTVHAPFVPENVYCSGANFKKHVADIIAAQPMDQTAGMTKEERRAYGWKLMEERAARGTPYFFMKSRSCVTGPVDPIVLPSDAKQPDWELELAVVIGRPAWRVKREQALDYVAGYTIANDVTTRERVNRKDQKEMGMDWVVCKSSPTYLPLGPYIVPAAFVPDPQNVTITLKLNGDTMQNESTSDMIFGVTRLIEFITQFVRLVPGDLICTGSPAGNGIHHGRLLKPGDVLEGSITGLGVMRNPCVAEG